jgi:predicted ATPase
VPRLLGLHIKNYKALHDVRIGQIDWATRSDVLPELCCFIGANGSGKSTLLDALGFLADSLREGVESACDKPQRGGFSHLRTQGRSGPIELILCFLAAENDRAIRYELTVDERNGVPIVARETLSQALAGDDRGRFHPFLKLDQGRGTVSPGKEPSGPQQQKTAGGRKKVKLDDLTKLGITTLGNLEEHPRIVALRSYIEDWYLSYFVPDAARDKPPAGPQRHLDRKGSNVGNVLQYFQRRFPRQFRQILARVAKAIPGLKKITPRRSDDGRLLLQFDESGYQDPFYQASMSDGTLKMLAYAVLLADPEPRPFIGIEEPENGLYHLLVESLARELLHHATGGKTQVLVTTHSPHFVDALKPEQVWYMQKNADGYATATKTSTFPAIEALVEEGIPLGSLWYSNHFDERVGS